MAAKKGVRNITLTWTDNSTTPATSVPFSGRLVGSVVYKGSTVEVDKIAAYGDTAYTSVPRSVKSWSEFSFTVLDQGTASSSGVIGDAALEGYTGKVVTVAIDPTYSSGASGESDSATVSCDMVITGVEPGGEISVDGESKSTIVIKAVPHAPAA